jgi:hypothetical protein
MLNPANLSTSSIPSKAEYDDAYTASLNRTHTNALQTQAKLKLPKPEHILSQENIDDFLGRIPAGTLYSELVNAPKEELQLGNSQLNSEKITSAQINPHNLHKTWVKFLSYVADQLDLSLCRHFFIMKEISSLNYFDKAGYSQAVERRQPSPHALELPKAIQILSRFLRCIPQSPGMILLGLNCYVTNTISSIAPNTFTNYLAQISLALIAPSALAFAFRVRQKYKSIPTESAINIETNHFLQLEGYNKSTSLSEGLEQLDQFELSNYKKDELFEAFLTARVLRMFGVGAQIFTDPDKYASYFHEQDLRKIQPDKWAADSSLGLQELMVKYLNISDLPIPKNLRSVFLDSNSEHKILKDFLETGNLLMIRLMEIKRNKARLKFIELFCSPKERSGN